METTENKACVQCGRVTPFESFYRSKRSTDGRDSYCKECRDGRSTGWAKAKRAARPPKPVRTEKRCPDCGVTKPLDEFYVAKSGGKASAYCRPCNTERHRAYVAQPAVAAKLLEQDRNRRSKTWKRPPRREPVGPGFEVCTMCNEDKPFAEFHKHKLGRNGMDSMCRECKRVVSRERNKDPEVQERSHRRAKERQFGLYPGQYDEMLKAQGHGCAICGGVNGNGKRLHVDHCHATAKVRALLCYGCNTGLGVFKDDPVLMRAAADYIEHHRHR